MAAGSEFATTRTLPHGHVAAVWAVVRQLGLPALLGPACRSRDLALGLIISRVIEPASKRSTLSGWADTTLGADLGIVDASTDEIYAAMDWLIGRQDAIERKLAAQHLGPQANPSKMALFDLSSTWMTGSCCELAARGYSRDGKKGLPQINFGVLGDRQGRPIAVRVFAGNTADPKAFTKIVTDLKDAFTLDDLVMVGDRGMITTARVKALGELNDAGASFGWITALRNPAIAQLAADNGPLQMSLFDQHDLVQIVHPDYPGERLIACRNPYLADQRARKRAELLAATEKLLKPINDRVQAGRLSGAADIGKAVGKVVGKYKVAKHFHTTITDDSFTYHRNQETIDAQAALDGIYVIRTSVEANALSPAAGRGSLQGSVQHRTRLPQHQNRRPPSTAHPPPPPRPRQSPPADLHAGPLLSLASTKSLGTTDIHRRKPTRSGQSRSTLPNAATHADAKAARQMRRRRQPTTQLRTACSNTSATLTRDRIRYHHTDVEIDKLTDPTPDPTPRLRPHRQPPSP